MIKGKELHKELSAFANTDGGILYTGVNDRWIL
jgi:predicted HTH transcriptional regulator